MSRAFAAAATAALFMLLLPSISFAENPIQFEFTATVSNVPADPGGDLAGSGIGIGDPVTGFYFFDGDAPAQIASDGTIYPGMAYYAKTTIEGRDFFAVAGFPLVDTFGRIRVRDRGTGASEELYFPEMIQLEESEIEVWRLTLQDPNDTTAIPAGEPLPQVPPNISLFTNRTLFFQTQSGGQVQANLTSLTLPEPGAAASLMAVFGTFGFLGRRKIAKSA